MIKFSEYIVPSLVVLLLIISLIKRNSAFDSFAIGAREGFNLAISVFPFLAAVFVCVTLFKLSGLSEYVTKLLTPIFNILGIPDELAGLILIKPFSGSGSLVELENIYNTYGADSYESRCASVILGSSETVFYISAVYFSKCKVKNLSYGIPLALLITLLGAITACFLCKYI